MLRICTQSHSIVYACVYSVVTAACMRMYVYRGDKALRKAVDALVGRVNGRYGFADYCPIVYVKRALPRLQVM
jgi:trehalose-6-phosphate synthase